jgi:hypothetical protein
MKIAAMGKGLAASAVLALTIAFAPVAAQAQNDAQAQAADEVTWARVTMIRFLPGKRDRALEIIKNYYAKADQMAGTGAGTHGIHLETGEWDIIYVFPMKDGPAELARRGDSPEDAKWMAEMVKLAGSEAEAQKIIAEFDTLIALSVEHIGHAHKDH